MKRSALCVLALFGTAGLHAAEADRFAQPSLFADLTPFETETASEVASEAVPPAPFSEPSWLSIAACPRPDASIVKMPGLVSATFCSKGNVSTPL